MNGELSKVESVSTDLNLAPCKLYPGEWLVEQVGSDGEVSMTRFSGPRAEERAKGYLALHGAHPAGASALDYGTKAFTLWDDNLQINEVGGESIKLKIDEARALCGWLSKVLSVPLGEPARSISKELATGSIVAFELKKALAEVSRMRAMASTCLAVKPTSGMMRVTLEKISGEQS